MPVHMLTTWAMSSSVTTGVVLGRLLVPAGAQLVDPLLALRLLVAQLGGAPRSPGSAIASSFWRVHLLQLAAAPP